MPEFEILKVQLPAVPDTPKRRLNPRGGAPRAAFVSQLIADRFCLVPDSRRPIGDALRSYDAGTRIALRRLPPGYRMALDA